MPNTIYSSGTGPWLQNKTEQKFKSGLFNVSAEYVRPKGSSILPTKINTSIGEVDIYPEPTVTTSTDLFEKINATGYDVFDFQALERKKFLIEDKIYFTAELHEYNPWINSPFNFQAISYARCLCSAQKITAARKEGSLTLFPTIDTGHVYALDGVTEIDTFLFKPSSVNPLFLLGKTNWLFNTPGILFSYDAGNATNPTWMQASELNGAYLNISPIYEDFSQNFYSPSVSEYTNTSRITFSPIINFGRIYFKYP